ncbi:hypothetical protein MW887_010480 [Aspergillus wentii]|nr:hypothetical protein MW887_010480 [Aspergillus wentii]
MKYVRAIDTGLHRATVCDRLGCTPANHSSVKRKQELVDDNPRPLQQQRTTESRESSQEPDDNDTSSQVSTLAGLDFDAHQSHDMGESFESMAVGNETVPNGAIDNGQNPEDTVDDAMASGDSEDSEEEELDKDSGINYTDPSEGETGPPQWQVDSAGSTAETNTVKYCGLEEHSGGDIDRLLGEYSRLVPGPAPQELGESSGVGFAGTDMDHWLPASSDCSTTPGEFNRPHLSGGSDQANQPYHQSSPAAAPFPASPEYPHLPPSSMQISHTGPGPAEDINLEQLANDWELPPDMPNAIRTSFPALPPSPDDACPPAGDQNRTVCTSLARQATADCHPEQSPARTSSIACTRWTSPLPHARQRWSDAQLGPEGLTNLVAAWEQLAQVALRGQPMGLQRADHLMQLAFNIASPAVFLGIKKQLAHLRAMKDAPSKPFQRGLAGVFAAGHWHKTNECTSRIGMALTCWYVHYRRQLGTQEGSPDPMGQVIREIQAESCHGSYACDRELVEAKVKDWCKKAWPWDQLARVANGPNVLCFLPQGNNHFPREDDLYFTTYRGLSSAQFAELGAILAKYRPALLSTVPNDFYESFLYNEPPSGEFEIERWTDQEILEQPLDSPKFAHAFRFADHNEA